LSFLNELKRRNVLRVGAAYIVGSWLLIQVAETIFPLFGFGDAPARLVVIVLFIGFIPSLIFAWAFEFTPEGLKKEADVDHDDSMARVTTRRLDLAILVVLLLALGYFAFDKFVLDPARDQSKVKAARQEGRTEALVESYGDKSIAVLPFVDMSADKDQEYMSDGIAEELLNLLARIPELRVISRSSAFSYKGKDIKLAKVAEELNVAHILEGSVRKAGNQVRITVQLVEARSDTNLWSQTYDRILDDIFVIQDEIAAAVVDGLKVTLLGAMPEQRETDPEVYALYLQGRYFTNIKSEENFEKALKVLNQAVAIDPDYAPAWVATSIVYGEQLKYGFLPAEQAFTLSMAAIEKALEIDPNMADAWASLAYLKRGRSDWAGAKVAIDKALELEPNNSMVIGAAATLAGTFGQLDKSIELFERNVRLNPLSLGGIRALAIRYVCAGRDDEALETLNRILVIHPGFPWIHHILAEAYLLKGDAETALIESNKEPPNRNSAFLKARIFSTLGREAEAQALIRQLLEGPADLAPLPMARTYAWRGENDLAFEWLEKMSRQNNPNYTLFLIEPWFRNLVNDPRYALYLEKIGLLEAWKTMPPEYGGPAKAAN